MPEIRSCSLGNHGPVYCGCLTYLIWKVLRVLTSETKEYLGKGTGGEAGGEKALSFGVFKSAIAGLCSCNKLPDLGNPHKLGVTFHSSSRCAGG